MGIIMGFSINATFRPVALARSVARYRRLPVCRRPPRSRLNGQISKAGKGEGPTLKPHSA